jgi:hypothetical protein
MFYLISKNKTRYPKTGKIKEILTSANNIRYSGEFSPSQKEQPGTVVIK